MKLISLILNRNNDNKLELRYHLNAQMTGLGIGKRNGYVKRYLQLYDYACYTPTPAVVDNECLHYNYRIDFND